MYLMTSEQFEYLYSNFRPKATRMSLFSTSNASYSRQDFKQRMERTNKGPKHHQGCFRNQHTTKQIKVLNTIRGVKKPTYSQKIRFNQMDTISC